MIRISLYLLLVLLFAGCSDNGPQSRPDIASAGKLLPLKHAKRFTIIDYGNFKKLSIRSETGVELNYVLYKHGTPYPSSQSNDADCIEVPVKNISCLSSLYVGFIDRLSETAKINAVDNIDYISNAVVREGVKAGKVRELAKSGNLNEELAIALHPDLIMTYGSSDLTTIRNKKVVEAGIPIVYCIDNKENTPLARAEWIKFIACFFCKEKEADSLFNETEKKYNELKHIASAAKEQPDVLLETKLSDAWYVPGGKSYMACLLKDAKAKYIWEADTNVVSLPLSFEEVYKKGNKAEYWLDLGFCNSKQDLLKLDARYEKFESFRKNNLFNYNKRSTAAGGNEFWETGLIMPDRILKDLIKIFHPAMFVNEELIYYKQLN